MSHFSPTRLTQLFFAAVLSVSIVLAGALPAFASSEDVSQDVAANDTQHKWFYWPGWLFVGLSILVIGLVLAYWIAKIVLPKYRGRKVAS